MAKKIKTKHFKTYQEVVLAVDHRLIDPEICRVAELYYRGKRMEDLRSKQDKAKS